MNNNKVTNQKTEVNKGPNLNEKDYLTDLLETEKSMVKNYTVALTEASNETLYQIYKEMFKNGWYCLEKVEENKVQEKLTTLNQELTDMNNN